METVGGQFLDLLLILLREFLVRGTRRVVPGAFCPAAFNLLPVK